MNSQRLLQTVTAFVALLLMFVAGPVTEAFAQNGVTYYVNNQTGSDANAGTDVNNPKQTLFGVNGALAAATDGATISVANTGVAYTNNNVTAFTQTITITSTGGTPTLNPGGAGAGTLTFATAGETTTFGGPFAVNANITLNQATGGIAGANNLALTTTTFTYTAGSITGSPTGTITTLLYNGAANVTAGTEFTGPTVVNLTATLAGGGVTLTLPSSKTISGVLTVAAGKTVALAGNTLTLNRATAGTNTHDVDGTVSATGSGGLALTTGAAGANHTFASGAANGTLPNISVNVSGTAQIGDAVGSNNGPQVINGNLTVSGGTVNVYSPVGNTNTTGVTGSVTNSGSGALTFEVSGTAVDATLRIGGNVLNSGTGVINFGTAGEADIFNIIGNLTNNGTVTQTAAGAGIANAASINFVGAAASPVTTIGGTVTNSPTFTGATDNADGGVGDLDTSGNINFGDHNVTVTGGVTNSPNATGMTVVAIGGADNQFNGNGRIQFTHTAARAISVGGLTNSGSGFSNDATNGGGIIGGFGAVASTLTVTGTGTISNQFNATENSGNGNITFAAWTGTVTTGSGGVSIAAGSSQADILFGSGALAGADPVANNSTSSNSNISTAASANTVTVGALTAAGGNITFSQTGNFSAAGATISGGLVNVLSTGTQGFSATVTITGGELQLADGGASTFGGGLNISGGTFDHNGTGSTATFNGNFVQSGGAVELAGDTVDINTDMSITGGTRTFGAAAPLTFTGGIAQTLTSSAGVTWTGNMTVTNTATVAPGLTLAGANFTVVGTVTFSAPGVGQPTPRVALGAFRLVVGGNAFTNNGGYSTSADTGGIQMANTAGASTIDGTANFANLEIATTGQTTTMTEGNNAATRQYTMTGLLSLTSGTLETSNAANSGTSDELVFNGTPTVKVGAGTFGANMANGDLNNEFVFTTAVNIIYAGTGNVNTAATANFLNAAGATGINDITIAIAGVNPTLTLGQSVTYNGSMTVPANTTLAMGNNNVTAEGTTFVNNGTITNGTGVLILDDAVGTAVSGSGDLPGVNVTGGANTISNATIGTTGGTDDLTVTGGSVTLNMAAPATGEENIEGVLTVNGANTTVTLGANITVGEDLHHTVGTIAMGANNLSAGQDLVAATHTLGTGAAALFSGTGTLTFTNSGAGNPTMTADAGGTSAITVPVNINLSANADEFQITNALNFRDTVTVTRGELNAAAGAATTFSGSAVTLTANSDLVATQVINFAPASGTQTLTVVNGTSQALQGAANYVQNGDLTINTGTAGITFPANFTQTSGALTINGNMVVTGTYTMTAGSVTQGANNLTATAGFTRTAGTFSQTTGALIIPGAFTQGASFSIANLNFTGAGAQAIATNSAMTVTGTLTLNNTNAAALDISPAATTVILNIGDGATINYVDGTLTESPIYAGAINLTASNGANQTIPANIWTTGVTVNTFTVNSGAVVAMPGNRTVQNEVHLQAGLLDLDDDTGVAGGNNNTDLTVANSTLRVTAGTIEAGAGGANTGGDLLFTNAPDVIYQTNAAYATGEELDNVATMASLTVTRSTNQANTVLTLNGTRTVSGALNVLDNLTIGATLTLQGALTVTNDSGNFAAATTPVIGGGTLVMGGTTAQTIPAIAALGNLTINNAAGVSTSGAVGATNVVMTNGTLTLGGNLTVGGGAPTGNNAAAASAGNLTLTGGKIVTGTNAVILDHEHTGAQGFVRAAGNTGCVEGRVRKLFDNTGGAGNAGAPDRMVFPLCDSNGNWRPAAFTFTTPNTLTPGNWIQVSHTDGLPGGANGMPFNATDNTNAAYTVARYAPFSWLVQMNFNEQAGVTYDVELRAEGYNEFSGESIERVRNIRRLAGLSTNFWSIMSPNASGNDNYAVSATEPVSVSRSALGLLVGAGTSGNEGTIFTMGLESNMTVTNPAAVSVNAGATSTVDLSTVFGGGTGAYSYAITSGDGAVATGAAAGNTLTVSGVGAGSTTLTVVATDQLNDTRTATVSVTVNPAFAAGTIAPVALNAGGTSTVDLSTVFSGGASPMTYAVSSSDAAAATGAESGGTLTITAVAAGSATITVVATDATSQTATATVAVTVNAAMSSTNPATISLTEGASSTVDLSTVFAGGDGTYTYAVSSAATNVTASEASGTLTVTAAEAYTAGTTIGTVDVTVTATDGLGSSVSATVTVDVLPVLGDLDGSGAPSAASASIVLDWFLGINTTLTAKQQTAADFNSDGIVNAYDAALIFNAFLNGKDELAPNVAANLQFGTVERADGMINIPLQIVGDLNDVVAASFTANIDPAKATVVAVNSDLDSEWIVKHTVSEEGELRIAVAGLGSVPTEGTIATISVQLTDAGAAFDLVADGSVNNNPLATLDAVEVVELPDTFTLQGNYPNPFNPTTTIQFDLPQSADVEVQVYDMVGRMVMTLPAQNISAGANRSVQLNASQLASGSYFYRVIARMESKTFVETGRMLLLK